MGKLPPFAALAALACLALAGCFKSKSLLLDLGQAAHPVPDGTWTGDDEDHTRLSLSAHGNAYLMVEGESRRDVVMTPLPGRDDAWAAAQADEGCAGRSDACEWEYAVVVVEGGRMRELFPSCEKDWPGVAADVASRNEAGDTCWFRDAARLQHALGQVAAHGSSAITYTRGD